MKLTRFKLPFSSLALLSSSAFAATDMPAAPYIAPYIGVQIGSGRTDLNDENAGKSFFNEILGSQTFDFHTTQKTQGLAGRVYGGYQFSTYFGAELGYAQFATSHSEVALIGLGSTPFTLSSKNRSSAIDAMATFSLPVTKKFFVSAKAGAAYVISQYEISFTAGGNKAQESFKAHALRPKFGLGTDYQFNDYVSLGIAYEFIPGKGEPYRTDGNADLFENSNLQNTNYSPRLQMLSLNLKYTF